MISHVLIELRYPGGILPGNWQWGFLFLPGSCWESHWDFIPAGNKISQRPISQWECHWDLTGNKKTQRQKSGKNASGTPVKFPRDIQSCWYSRCDLFLARKILGKFLYGLLPRNFHSCQVIPSKI